MFGDLRLGIGIWGGEVVHDEQRGGKKLLATTFGMFLGPLNVLAKRIFLYSEMHGRTPRRKSHS